MSTDIPHILVVDDDEAIRELLESYLAENRLRVSSAGCAKEMSLAMSDSVIDLLVLELRLRDEDGMQLARQVRENSEIPVIMITGVQDEADRVMGLEFAADDYLVKPFSTRELLARIRAVLRRYRVWEQRAGPGAAESKRRAYRFAGWELNLCARRLNAPDGHRVELSNGEFNLLLALCEAPQRVLSRDHLLRVSRLHGAEVYDRAIDIQILRLRRKIERDPSLPELICTQRGSGYVFAPRVEIVM